MTRCIYEIAINKGLYPISRYIEHNLVDKTQKNFYTEWNDAFTEHYIQNDICHSEQQHDLIEFFKSNGDKTLSIIAPTSYGKSELILSAIEAFAGKRICILTSTKALLTQTRKRVKQMPELGFAKIIVHPEMYNSQDESCLAILTQERLLKLLKKDSLLSFDCIVVDEAHELLDNDQRSQVLASVLTVAQKRKPDTVVKFLTPFLEDTDNL